MSQRETRLGRLWIADIHLADYTRLYRVMTFYLLGKGLTLRAVNACLPKPTLSLETSSSSTEETGDSLHLDP